MEMPPPADPTDLIYYIAQLTAKSIAVLGQYILGLAIVLLINKLYISVLSSNITFSAHWSVVIPPLVFALAWCLYTFIVIFFGIPDPQAELHGRTLAPSFSWAVTWSIAFSFVAATTISVCAFVVLKPLQLLDLLPHANEKIRTYNSSKFRPRSDSGSRLPVVKLELARDARLSNCQHSSTVSPVSIKSLCKDLKPGETLAIYKDGSQGINDEDYIGIFHVFGLPMGREDQTGHRQDKQR